MIREDAVKQTLGTVYVVTESPIDGVYSNAGAARERAAELGGAWRVEVRGVTRGLRGWRGADSKVPGVKGTCPKCGRRLVLTAKGYLPGHGNYASRFRDKPGYEWHSGLPTWDQEDAVQLLPVPGSVSRD
jgi:hypothetical protein